jgi:hypothetical protein
VVPEIFLQAYALTGRDKYFEMARKIIMAWAKYEGSTWLPRGFLWNDHAIAARVPVLARFWAEYRNRPDFDTEEARLILGFVARSGQMLAKPSHYTFSTNHGVMQNLALWHLSLAFPAIPGVASYRKVAAERFALQMQYYINDEGIILEHSAGYHREGLRLLGMGFKYVSMLGMPIPPSWAVKYTRAKDFYAQLRRPDGSLPLFGDTGGPENVQGLLVTELDASGTVTAIKRQVEWEPSAPHSIYPVGGYTVWWSGLRHWPDVNSLTQTVVTWSNFPGHGHKHADDMSILFWAAGQTWWTNVGYWPYYAKGRDKAASWEGSNAPHLAGEREKSKRTAGVRFFGEKDGLAAIDLERTGPQGYRVRRQVLDIKDRLWIVIDSAHNPTGRPTRTVWRTYPDVRVLGGKTQGMYRLVSTRVRTSVDASLFASGPVSIQKYRGSYEPFAWIAVDGVPSRTSVLVIDQPPNTSWLAFVWGVESPDTGSRLTGTPAMRRWVDSGDWLLAVPTSHGTLQVERKGTKVRVSRADGDKASIDLISGAAGFDTVDAKRKLQQAYAATKARYPKYRNLIRYRASITKILIGLVLLQELFFFVYTRLSAPLYGAFRLASVVGWLAGGLWLMFVYFKA